MSGSRIKRAAKQRLTGEVTNNYNRCAYRHPYLHTPYQPDTTEITPAFHYIFILYLNIILNSAPVT